MLRKTIFVLISSLMSTGAWAGPPGANTHGSTTTTVTADVDNVGACLVSALAIDADLADGALTTALAQALSQVNLSYNADVTLDLTRHGKNGAVHQADLAANMSNGTLYAQVVKSEVSSASSASAVSSADVSTAVTLIAQALQTISAGINERIDLEVIKIRVRASASATSEVDMLSIAASAAQAGSASGASSSSSSSAQASATSGGSSDSGASFYVQGANIEEFQGLLSLSSGALVDVETEALTQTYADALATSLAVALAQASVLAVANSRLVFQYDLPVIGSGTLPVIFDFDTASDAAQEIAAAADAIISLAAAMAETSAKTIASSSIDMNLSVQYENLPGTEDLLEATAAGNFSLDCTRPEVSADAQAVAY